MFVAKRDPFCIKGAKSGGCGGKIVESFLQGRERIGRNSGKIPTEPIEFFSFKHLKSCHVVGNDIDGNAR